MAKTRSPNYPAFSLGEAIALVAKIHEKDMRNRMSRETVADHLGYKGLSGPALGKLAALRAYGLLDGGGDDLRVSDAAVTIIADEPSSDDRQQEIQNAAFRPKLFQSLYDHFDGQRPSEANLRSYLIKEDFTPTAAEKLVHIYLDTFDLASREGGEYNANAGGEEEGAELTPIPEVLTQVGLRPLPPLKRREVKPGMKEDVYTLKEGDVVFQWPDRLSSESYEDLKDWTALLLRKIARHVTVNGAMATEYTDDEEGRQAEKHDREREG